MKKIHLFLVFVALLNIMKAQITLDVIYPNAKQKLYMVNLEVSGMKYVVKSDDQGNRFLSFYNLNHSLWKTINCNAFPTATLAAPGPSVLTIYNFDALYISETLFDCDNSIEFMYVSWSPNRWFTGIYKENGTALFTGDSMAPLVKGNVPQQYRPIYNTPGKTKLILSHWNGSARVYDLPCALSTGIDQKMMGDDSDPSGMEVFPNPSYYESTINYQLPKDVKSAELRITDMSGREIKSYTVDNTFSSLLIPLSDISPGTYIYSLNANGKTLDSKKIVLSSR